MGSLDDEVCPVRGRAEKVAFAKKLRRRATLTEQVLWCCLRRSRLGVKFSRQRLVCGWIADFCARSARLVVEVDGDSHIGKEADDAFRDRIMRENGWKVLRLTNAEVMGNLQGALNRIRGAMEGPSKAEDLVQCTNAALKEKFGMIL